MAGTTTVLALPYPTASDANNVPADILALANRIDSGSIIERMSTATRDALGAGRKVTGVVIWNTTTLTLQRWDGAAWVDVVPGAWASYTPTLAGTGWALGNGTAQGRWCQVGKTVSFRFSVTFGSTSTYGAGASPTVTLPATPAADWDLIPVQAIQSGGSSFPVFARYVSAALAFATPAGANVTSSAPFTWSSGAVLRGGGSYEAA